MIECPAAFAMHQAAHLAVAAAFFHLYLRTRHVPNLGRAFILMSLWSLTAFVRHFGFDLPDDFLLLASVAFLSLSIRRDLCVVSALLAPPVFARAATVVLSLYTVLAARRVRVGRLKLLSALIFVLSLSRFAGQVVKGVADPCPYAFTATTLTLFALATAAISFSVAETGAKLERRAKYLTLLNRIVRHDLLNQLAVADGYLELHETLRDPSYLERARKTIRDSVELIERLRSDAVESTISGREVKGILKRIAEEYPIRLDIELDDDTLIVANGLLYPVLSNIVQNAYRHGGENVKVTVSVREFDDHISISVADDGPGVPNWAREKIFREGFSYGERAGSGMGLYLVKVAVDEWGGEISVTDNVPRGAVFTIRLKKAKKLTDTRSSRPASG